MEIPKYFYFRVRVINKGTSVEVEDASDVDVAEVVRCKDCKHRDPEDHKCDSGALERAGCIFPVQDEYFCSCGERRKDETN